MCPAAGASTKELYISCHHHARGRPRNLGEEAYTNIAAYLLDANGAKAGRPRSARIPTSRSSVANGKVIPEAIAAPSLARCGRGSRARAKPRRRPMA